MPYLWSVVAAVVAVLVLGALAATLAGPARRLRTVQAEAVASIRDGVGLVSARVAALKVRLAERRT